MLKSTLIGGLVLGVVGGLPILNAINCACCALIIGAGFLAAYLYSGECRKAGAAFGPKNGWVVGLVAGLFYALASSLVGLPFRPGIEEMQEGFTQLEQFGAPPEAIEMGSRFAETMASSAGIVFGFLFTLLLAAVFSTLGGMIGGIAFKVEPAPAAPGSSFTP